MTFQPKRFTTAAALLMFSLLAATTVFAKENPTITQFGHDIVVASGQKTGELTCFGCSIHVRGGEVDGEITVFFGSIILDDGSQVAGEVTGFGGEVRVAKGASIAGDLSVLGGHLRRDPESNVAGDVTSLEGRGWLLAIFGSAVLVLGLFLGLVIWLIQRLWKPGVPMQGNARAA